jgi:hypothetical protein
LGHATNASSCLPKFSLIDTPNLPAFIPSFTHKHELNTTAANAELRSNIISSNELSQKPKFDRLVLLSRPTTAGGLHARRQLQRVLEPEFDVVRSKRLDLGGLSPQIFTEEAEKAEREHDE